MFLVIKQKKNKKKLVERFRRYLLKRLLIQEKNFLKFGRSKNHYAEIGKVEGRFCEFAKGYRFGKIAKTVLQLY